MSEPVAASTTQNIGENSIRTQIASSMQKGSGVRQQEDMAGS